MAEKENNIINKDGKNLILKIKSKYILAELFDFIQEKHKLKIISYNKEIQNVLNISLNNYRQISGRYIVLERNHGIGKEYLNDDNILIFEGEYKNMIRNGKGKEFYKNGKVQFEGEYLNGKRWKGTIYNYAGVKEFEIENGTGRIREYTINGVVIYEGDIINGNREGYGEEYYHGKLEYQGIFMKGKREVEGTEYYPNGKIEYEGGFFNGERNGEGKQYELDGTIKYKGEFFSGIWNGKGEEYKDRNLIFKGIYKSGKRWDGNGYDNSGQLLYQLKNGCGYVKEYNDEGILIFEGKYINGVRFGEGKEYNEEKELIFEGTYINGKRSKGKGKDFNLSGGLKYEGEYSNGEWDGKGKEYENNGVLSFEGIFSKGKRWTGYGKEFYNMNIIEFEGEYLNGERSKGIEYSPNGEIIFKGSYLNKKKRNKVFELFYD